MTKETKKSLKEGFVDEILSRIITGQYSIGMKLPSERDLAEKMGISRTVIRSGLTDLENMGAIKSMGRSGNVVVDYRLEGKMPIFDAIMTSERGISDELLRSFVEARIPIETETARLAALNRTNENLYTLFSIMKESELIADDDLKAQADQEFRFHQYIGYASGNAIHPILLNSMKNLALKLWEEMYCANMDRKARARIQEMLYEAIMEKNPDRAIEVMEMVFYHRLP